MKTISLSQGKVALVDDCDYDRLMSWSWSTKRTGHVFYAVGRRRGHGYEPWTFMHRVILDPDPGWETDHINGNGLDNRRCNLRLCTRAENSWNQCSRTGSSVHKGVHWHRSNRAWQANITVNGKRIHLGSFPNQEDAAHAYNEAAAKYFGEFARLNRLDNLSI